MADKSADIISQLAESYMLLMSLTGFLEVRFFQ